VLALLLTVNYPNSHPEGGSLFSRYDPAREGGSVVVPVLILAAVEFGVCVLAVLKVVLVERRHLPDRLWTIGQVFFSALLGAGIGLFAGLVVLFA
jgi:hypothetical protein